MYYTYILQTIEEPAHFYTGSTSNLKSSNLKRRIIEHNSGQSIHTNKFRPWKIKSYAAFNTKEKSLTFEKYLKSASGRRFIKRFF